MTTPRRRAFVLGGGVAGLTAAFGLADRGFAVRLLESRRWLGGRAFSSPDRATGQLLDNGPHVMLGCYRGMRALLARLGTAHLCRRDRALALACRTADARTVRLVLPRLPVPLALPWSLLRLPVPWSARWRALRGVAAVLRPTPAHCTLADWLRERRQHGVPADLLWVPLCRAIMNVEPQDAAAGDFLATLREAFGGSAAEAAFWLPLRPWSELLGDAAPAALRAAGVEVTTGAQVTRFEHRAERIAALALGDGARLELDARDLVVSALPWFQLHRLLPAGPVLFGTLRSSPIVSVHWQLAAGAAALPDDDPVVVLAGGDPFHFVIRRPGDDPRRFALMAGGNRSFDGQDVGTIVQRGREQLQRSYPALDLGAATACVRKEQHATFIAACGSERLRPRPGRLPDGPANLLVCGDWTATGLPATLEGAARSAAAMLAACDQG